RQWKQKLGEGKVEEAFLDIRPPAERVALRNTYQKRVGVARLAAAFSPGSSGPDADWEESLALYLPGYRAFTEGNLVQLSPERFWAPDGVRAEVPREVKSLFTQPSSSLTGALQLDQVRFMHWSREAERLRINQDCHLMLLPKYTATGVLIVEG